MFRFIFDLQFRFQLVYNLPQDNIEEIKREPDNRETGKNEQIGLGVDEPEGVGYHDDNRRDFQNVYHVIEVCFM